MSRKSSKRPASKTSKPGNRRGLPPAPARTSRAAAQLVGVGVDGGGRVDGRRAPDGSRMERRSYFLESGELERLKRAAYHLRMDQADIVRAGLRAQLDREEKRHGGTFPAVPDRARVPA